MHLKSCVGKDHALQYAKHHADATRMQQQHTALVGVGDVNSASAATMSPFVLRLSNAKKNGCVDLVPCCEKSVN